MARPTGGGCVGRCLLPLLLLAAGALLTWEMILHAPTLDSRSGDFARELTKGNGLAGLSWFGLLGRRWPKASLLDWSLISLINMIILFAIRFVAPRRGFRTRRLYALLWCTIVYSALAILAQVTFHIIWCIEGKGWSVAHAWWVKLVGLAREQPQESSLIYFLVIQLSAAVLALVEVFGSRLYEDSCWLNFTFGIEQIGYHLRVACCLLLPVAQLAVSISHPSWISLPFFVFSCIGLVDWSLTSNFLGLFRWWRLLEIYSVFSILLLYVYQLPVKFPYVVHAFADFIGLFKVSLKSEWPGLASGISLLVYYFMVDPLSSAKQDIQEMDSLMSVENESLTEDLLPSRNPFLVRQSRSGRRHANVLLRGSVFRTFSINFFTYGFPVLFFLIVVDRIIYLWSFATGKVVFYLFNLVLFTYSVTEYAWGMELAHRDVGGFVLRAIYLTKSVSLALQALQIRYGIPNKSNLYRQFLTSKVTQVNYLGFRLYRALPFLYELRCVLDWSCTTTSLTMYDWLKIYSSGNPTNIANPIIDVSVKIDIKALGGRLTFFKTTACEKIPWKYLKTYDDVDPLDYLGAYNVDDIQLICCQPDASTMWLIPPPVQSRFVRSLEETEMILGKMDLILSWDFLRARPKGKELVKYESAVDHCPSVDDVKKVLNGTANSFSIIDAYPRYFRVTGSGEVRRLEATIDSVSGELLLNNGTTPWWSFYDTNPSDLAGCQGLNGPMAIVVSEETPQGIIGEALSKFSIWSLYITFVLAVARFIRLQCSDLRMRIPYENLPSCDRYAKYVTRMFHAVKVARHL
ncbi:hypothetical protein ACP70R_037470 [Stipagrostis hirtigluma subsp. patula]